MSAPKNYTVRQMAKEPGFTQDVALIQAKHPHWPLKAVREDAARRAFVRKIRRAALKTPEPLDKSTECDMV
jgi:hypothetical protein